MIESEIMKLDYNVRHLTQSGVRSEYAMRMRHAKILPFIILALFFSALSARGQKPTPVTDPAFQELKAKAEKGDPEAQLALGSKYEEEDYAEATSGIGRLLSRGMPTPKTISVS